MVLTRCGAGKAGALTGRRLSCGGANMDTEPIWDMADAVRAAEAGERGRACSAEGLDSMKALASSTTCA